MKKLNLECNEDEIFIWDYTINITHLIEVMKKEPPPSLISVLELIIEYCSHINMILLLMRNIDLRGNKY